MHFRSALLTCVIATFACPGLALAAPTITEFAAPDSPLDLTAGMDGNLWLTADGSGSTDTIGRMTPGGALTAFTGNPINGSKPYSIVAGPGGVWFTANEKHKLIRVTPSGTATAFTSYDKPTGIALGPDGNLWYTAHGQNGAIGRMTPTGVRTDYTAGLTDDGDVEDIVRGPDDNLWFTAPAARRVGRITPQGVITEFGGGVLAGNPQEITPGPDGNLWFTEGGVSPAISRITPSGTITRFTSGLTFGAAPRGITTGADGNLYATDAGDNAILRITPSGAITRHTTGLSGGAGLEGITSGPDGRLWFAERAVDRVGRMSVAPTVGATLASAVDDTTATLASTVRPNAEATSYRFEWGSTTAYGQSTAPMAAGSGSSVQSADGALTGLAPSTTYHARLVATNATGTSVGPDLTFATTAPGAPSATSLPATDVTASRATINATVNPSDVATSYRFEWGRADAATLTDVPPVDAAVGSDATEHAVSEVLTGLQPNTAYRYRVLATSSAGTSIGAEETFATMAPPPGATTAEVTQLSPTGARLAAVVEPRNSVTAYRFEWGRTDSYGTAGPLPDAVLAADDEAHTVERVLDDLLPATTYHGRVVAISNAGTTTGVDRVFTTPAAPSPPAVVGSEAGPAPTPTPPEALPEPRPTLGRTAVASVVRGVVSFRAPGSSRATPLTDGAAIPSGAIIDARAGTIALVSALDARGETQTARFRGTTFRMALSRATPGLVDLTLTSRPTGCRTSRGAAPRGSAAKAKAPVRLWGSDRRGKYRTHGRNSVAVVRGTEWTTTETCAGTLTRVVSGAVAVRDRHTRRQTLVRAGRTYLARAVR